MTRSVPPRANGKMIKAGIAATVIKKSTGAARAKITVRWVATRTRGGIASTETVAS
jgi:hypothetical protein